MPYPGQPGYPGHPAPGGHHSGSHGLGPPDALVNPPGAGLEGWLTRLMGAVRRGWRQLLPILLLTQVVPGALISGLLLVFDRTGQWEDEIAAGEVLPAAYWADLGSLFAVLAGGTALLGLVQAAGWAAGTWVITRQASGAPADVSAALNYGVRRAPALWGWTLLVGFIVTIGMFCCFLPGLVAGFMLSMTGPVFLFERADPIGRSFQMFRNRAALLSSRVALVVGATLVFLLLTTLLDRASVPLFGAQPLTSLGTALGAISMVLVIAVLMLPAYFAQLVGFVVTYAEQRAHEGPVNSARLVAELR
ncbi:hypothetical protein ACLQ2S_02240 [Micromonospora sp. DT48]|uniref:hypothetical protein n=1 Tax=Micromonospora sp. DT48 TaxID=3393429 RepID=UPI003CEF7D35